MFASLIIRYKLLIIISVVILVVVSMMLIPRLKVDVRFSTFFPTGAKQLTFYEDFSSKMGSSDPFIFLAVKSEENIFDILFLKKVDDFVMDCKKLPFIKKVHSITNSSSFIKTPFGIISSPYLHLAAPEKLEEDSLRITQDAFLTKRFYSKDSEFLSIIIEMEEDLDLKKADRTIALLDSLIAFHNLKESHLLGKKYMEVQYNRMVKKEMGRSLLLSMVFMVLVLGFLYRSLSGILLPLLSMFFGLLLLYGFLALTGRSLGILANLFPTIMLIVGLSDVIHIFAKYNLESQKGFDVKQAILLTIKEIGLTTFLTSFTTALGFLTLTTSSMTAINNFGWDAALGVMISYAVSIVFVPAVLLTLRVKIPVRNRFFSEKWNSFSEIIFQLIDQNPKKILGVSLSMLGMSLIGIFQINTNNLQLTNIPDNHRLKSDFNVFEKELGGGRIFEMAVICKNKNGFDLEALREIKALHKYLESFPEIEKVFSPITFYHGISKIFEPRLDLLGLPESNTKLKRYVKRMDKSLLGSDWKLVDSTQKLGRISARMKDLGRQKVKALNSEISTWILANLDTTFLQFHFTGTDLLIDRAHELRIQNMGEGLAIAVFAVALIMGLISGNFPMILITLAVNILPLIMLGGIMGFMDIELRGTSSIIFTIAFVISVDDTIHFLSKLKIERQNGLLVRTAVQKTINETLKPIMLTSLILFGGFFVLIHSDFWDVYVHGVLVSITILIALIIDMFLLPVLILRFIKNDA